MIAYFTKLFKYDLYANLKMLESIVAAGIVTGKPVDIMAHTMAAQQRWLVRCKNLPVANDPLWPNDVNAAMLKPIIEQYHHDWIAYLGTLQSKDLQQTFTYATTLGETFTNTLEDILAHVINHGTHHRAQMGQQLKLAGAEQLPITDYIFFIREL